LAQSFGRCAARHRASREEQHLRACCLNSVARGSAFVRGEIVEDHDVAGPQRWYQDLLDVGDEAFPGHGSIQNHGRGHPRQPKRTCKRGRFPMAMRNWRATSLSSSGATAQASHLRRRAGFVDKDQMFGIKIRLGVEPRLTLRGDVGPCLLARVCCFF